MPELRRNSGSHNSEPNPFMETYFPDTEMPHTRIAGQRVVADVKALITDSEALLRATASDVSEKGRAARARLAAAVERAKITCAEIQERGLETAREAVKRTDETIRARPYESMAVAFGVGIVIGILLRRR